MALFANAGGVAAPAEFFIGFVLPANSAVMALRLLLHAAGRLALA
jgi:hypothetical protein